MATVEIKRGDAFAIEVSEEDGINIKPEIMIPLVGSKKELAFVKKIVVDTIEKIFAEQNTTM